MEEQTATHEAKIEDAGPCKKLVRITIPPEGVQGEIDRKYTEIIRNTPFPGFRKGHVPRRLVEKRLGEEILGDVKQSLVVETLEKTLEEHALDPLEEPELDLDQIELKPGEALVFEVTFEVKPTFDLPEYKGIEVVRETASVSDDEVDKALDRFARARATYEPSKAKQIRPNDLVLARTALLQGDAPVLEQDNDQFLPEDGRLYGIEVPDLAARMKGATLGEALEIEVEIPGGVKHAKVRPGAATIRVVPQEIKRLRVPRVDDQLAAALDFESAGDLRADVRKRLQREADREADRRVEDRILEGILKETPIEVPEGLVEREMEKALERERIRLQLDGTEEAEVDSRIEAVREKIQAGVRLHLQKAFLLEKIASAEKIFVTEGMVRRAQESIAARQHKPIAEVLDWFDSKGRLGELRTELRERMTREALRRGAKITDRKG